MFLFEQQSRERRRHDLIGAGQCAGFPSWHTRDKLHAGSLGQARPQKVSFWVYLFVESFSYCLLCLFCRLPFKTSQFCVSVIMTRVSVSKLHCACLTCVMMLLLFRLQVYPLHSTVTLEEQNGVFLSPVPGYRKVQTIYLTLSHRCSYYLLYWWSPHLNRSSFPPTSLRVRWLFQMSNMVGSFPQLGFIC